MIMDTVIAETGKARTDAMSMEVFSVADSLCYYAKNTEKFLRRVKEKFTVSCASQKSYISPTNH